MGWTSSTGIIQHIHRNLLLPLRSSTSGVESCESLSTSNEITRDKPIPKGMNRKQEPLVEHVSLRRIDAKDASDSLGVQATWR
eukprot:7104465-Karenia_brevis.AAC.1